MRIKQHQLNLLLRKETDAGVRALALLHERSLSNILRDCIDEALSTSVTFNVIKEYVATLSEEEYTILKNQMMNTNLPEEQRIPKIFLELLKEATHVES